MRRWLLCLLMLLSGGCAMSNGDATSVPQTRMTVMPASPARTPSPVPVIEETRAPVCDNTPVSRLIVHERGKVTNNGERLNIRAGAGTRFRVIGKMEPQDLFLVVGGPECSDEYTWYQVQYGDLVGWIAEGDFVQYYAEPYLPG